MKEVEGPAAVLVTALDHDLDGFTEATVGLDSCIPQKLASAKDFALGSVRIFGLQ